MKSYSAIFGTIFVIMATSPYTAARTREDVEHLVKHPEEIVGELGGQDAAEAADLILQTLEAIEEAEISPREKGERIARAVGCAIYALDDMAPEVFGLLGPQIRPERLTLVTASAVISSGLYSAQLINAMLEGAVSDAQREMIAEAAGQPAKYLTRAEMRECQACAFGIRPLPIRPEPIRPLPDDPERVRERPRPRIPQPPPPYDGQQ